MRWLGRRPADRRPAHAPQIELLLRVSCMPALPPRAGRVPEARPSTSYLSTYCCRCRKEWCNAMCAVRACSPISGPTLPEAASGTRQHCAQFTTPLHQVEDPIPPSLHTPPCPFPPHFHHCSPAAGYTPEDGAATGCGAAAGCGGSDSSKSLNGSLRRRQHHPWQPQRRPRRWHNSNLCRPGLGRQSRPSRGGRF